MPRSAQAQPWAQRVDAAKQVFHSAARGNLAGLVVNSNSIDEARRTLAEAADRGEVARLFGTTAGLLEDCCSTLALALSAVPQLADAPCADANSTIADVMSGVGRSLRIALASWCGGGSTLSTASARRIEGTGLLPALAKAFTTWAAALHPNSPPQQQMAQLPPREQQQQFNQLAYPLGQPVLLWQHLLMYCPGAVLGKL